MYALNQYVAELEHELEVALAEKDALVAENVEWRGLCELLSQEKEDLKGELRRFFGPETAEIKGQRLATDFSHREDLDD